MLLIIGCVLVVLWLLGFLVFKKVVEALSVPRDARHRLAERAALPSLGGPEVQVP